MRFTSAWLLSACFVCFVVGCVRQTTYVSTYQVHRHLAELRESGHADVEGHRIGTGSEVGFRGRPALVAELIEGCPLEPPMGRLARRQVRSECRLVRARQLDLGRHVNWRASAGLWAGASLVMVVVGVVLGLVISADRRDSHCDIACP